MANKTISQLTSATSVEYNDYFIIEQSGITKKATLYTLGMGKPSNPNLLDNWYFKNPVNQRGSSSYTVNGYTIDRWRTNTSSFTVNFGADGVYFSGLSAVGRMITQYLDPAMITQLLGQTVTLSVLVSSDCSGYMLTDTGSIAATHFDTAISSQLTSKTFAITSTAPTAIAGFGIWNSSTSPTGTIYAIKLELGSEQTLAHQDSDGNWVLNEIPDYGEQLRRCQRFFRRIKATNSNAQFAMGVASSTTNVYMHFHLGSMRTTPTLSTSGTFSMIGTGSPNVSKLALGVYDDDNTAVVLATAASTITQYNPYILQAKSSAGAYIDFSADL